MDDKGRGRISMLKLYERICKDIAARATEPCYRKPKKWILAAGVTFGILLGTIGGVIGSSVYFSKKQDDAVAKVEKAKADELYAKKKVISSLETNLASLEKEKKQSDATIKSMLSLDKNREINKLTEEIRKLTEDFEKYRKDYPETLLREKSSLESRLAAVQKELSEAKNYFAEYAKNHPYLSAEEYDALLSDRKKLEQAQSTLKQVEWELEDYKKSHSAANFEALKKEKEGLVKRCADLEEKLKGKYEHSFDNCLVYRDQKTNEFFIYFDITYDTALPPESIIEKAGDWAGPKRVGRYITREQAGKLNVWSTLGKEYTGELKDSFENLWVLLREKQGKVDYFLVIETKPSESPLVRKEVGISEEQIKEFISSCMSKR